MSNKGSYIVGTAIALIFTGLIAFPTQGLAAEPSCSYIGSWYGYTQDGSTIEWTINVNGQSQASGTNNLDDLVFDPKLGGAFPNAVKMTPLKGVWNKTGDKTFAITMLGYAVDGNGGVQYYSKMSGTVTILDDCNKDYLELTMEFFLPNQNPFGDTAYYAVNLPNHYGYRMRVDPSPEIPQ